MHSGPRAEPIWPNSENVLIDLRFNTWEIHCKVVHCYYVHVHVLWLNCKIHCPGHGAEVEAFHRGGVGKRDYI